MMIVRVCDQFLGLPWHPAITKFISDHMRARGGGHRARDSDLHTTSLDSRLKVGPQMRITTLRTWCLRWTSGGQA